jgi:spore germination cell wall hydrolase CwlJ-like protein
MYNAYQVYDLTLLMLCIYRESRGESDEAHHAVGWVIKNRVTLGGWYGKGWAGVILKPWQFSSFNPADPNASKLPFPDLDPSYGSCLLAAKHVYDGTSVDPTFGATHYHDTSIAAPAWAKDMDKTVQIGRLVFYKEKA